MNEKMKEMLKLKKWAVVGANNNPEKFGYKIFKALLQAGYDVTPVNPGLEEVLGVKCYPSLEALPTKPDAVDVVVSPKIGETTMEDCARLGIKNFWLQPGADDEKVISKAEQLSLHVIHHACIMVEIRNFVK
jgi:predicted CoA-binding protein